MGENFEPSDYGWRALGAVPDRCDMLGDPRYETAKAMVPAGLAVALCWVAMAGRWRWSEDWVERLGRVAGLA